MLRSLCNFTPSLIEGEMLQLFHLCFLLLDGGMMARDARQVVTSLDIALILSEFVKFNQPALDRCEKIKQSPQQVEDKMKPLAESHAIYFSAGCPRKLRAFICKAIPTAKTAVGYMSAVPED